MEKRNIVGLVLILLTVLCGCMPLQKSIPTYNHVKTMVDDQGHRVDIPDHPQRVLTLSSAFDVILIDLLPPERIVATSKLSQAKGFSINWKAAGKVKKAVQNYSLESIIALNPDLVFVPEYASQDIIDGLRGMGIPIFILRQPKTVEQVIHTIDIMGDVLSVSDRSRTMICRIQKQMEYLQHKVNLLPKGGRRSVLFQSSMDGYTGKNSLFDDMCRYMGVYNAPVHRGYPERTSFTEERIIAMNPDVFLIPVYGETKGAWIDSFIKNPVYGSLKARKNNMMKTIPAKYLYTGNQYIGFSMIRIMSEVYPHLFTEEDRKRYPVAYEK